MLVFSFYGQWHRRKKGNFSQPGPPLGHEEERTLRLPRLERPVCYLAVLVEGIEQEASLDQDELEIQMQPFYSA